MNRSKYVLEGIATVPVLFGHHAVGLSFFSINDCRAS